MFTGEGAAARIRLASRSLLKLGENSLVVIEGEKTKDTSINLVRGLANILATPDAKPIAVTVGNRKMKLVGKKSNIQLASRKDGTTNVIVLKGKVTVHDGKSSRSVNQGSAVPLSEKRGILETEKIPVLLQSPSNEARFFVTDRSQTANISLVWRVMQGGKDLYLELSLSQDFSSLTTKLPLDPNTTQKAMLISAGIHYWRISSFDRTTKKTQFSEARRISVVTDAPPSLAFPLADQIFTVDSELPNQKSEALVNFKWESDAVTPFFELLIGRNQEFSDIAFQARPSGRHLDAKLLPIGSYYWRVRRASNSGDKPGPWSPVGRFAIKAEELIQPPNLKAPTSDAVLKSKRVIAPVHFTWDASPKARGYQVVIAKTEAFDTPNVILRQTLIDQKYQWQPPSAGTYYWHVGAIDARGRLSKFSDRRSFSIKIPPPSRIHAPKLKPIYQLDFPKVQPKGSSHWRMFFRFESVAYAADERLQTLQWSDVPDAVAYYVEIAEDREFNRSLLKSKLTRPSFNWLAPRPGKYYLRVAAEDVEGERTAYSDPALIVVNFQPPQNLLPGSGSTLVRNQKSIEFSWNPIPGAKEYVLEIAKNSDFSNLVSRHTSSRSRYAVENLDAGSFYWRVGTRYAPNLPWRYSTTHELILTKPPNTPPKFITALALGPLAYGSVTKLQWGPVPDARGYTLEASTSSTFKKIMFRKSTKKTAMTTRGTITGKSYWRVIAKFDNNIDSLPSELTVINIVSSPSAPTLVTPPAKAKVEVDEVSKLIAFSWLPIPSAKSYQIEFKAKNKNFKTIQSQTTSLTSLQQALAPGEYRWSVLAIDYLNQKSEPSKARSLFVQQRPPLAVPKRIAPSDGEMIDTAAAEATVRLSWSSVPDADTYELEWVQLDPSSKPQKKILSADSFDVPLALGRYGWRIRSLAAKRKPGAWTKQYIIEVLASAQAPVLLEPGNDSTIEIAPQKKSAKKSAGQTSTPVTLTWSDSLKAQNYEVEWEPRNQDAAPKVHKVTKDRSTIRLSPGIYRWRVRSLPKNRAPGIWSPYRGFEVVMQPNPPELLSPPQAARIELEKRKKANKIRFAWSRLPQAQAYRFVLSRDKQQQKSIQTTETPSTFIELTDLHKGQYYWSVEAVIPRLSGLPRSRTQSLLITEKKPRKREQKYLLTIQGGYAPSYSNEVFEGNDFSYETNGMVLKSYSLLSDFMVNNLYGAEGWYRYKRVDEDGSSLSISTSSLSLKWRPPFVPGPFGVALDVRGGLVADFRTFERSNDANIDISGITLKTSRYYTVGGIGLFRGFGRGFTLNSSAYIGMAIGDGTNSVKNDRIFGAITVIRYHLLQQLFISPAIEFDLQKWDYQNGEDRLAVREIDRRFELGLGLAI